MMRAEYDVESNFDFSYDSSLEINNNVNDSY